MKMSTRLNKKESMLQKSFSFSYSKLTLLGLAFLYFILPLPLQYVVGEDFYIYSKYQFAVMYASVWFYALLFVFIVLLLKNIKTETFLNRIRPSSGLCRTIYFINIAYLLIVLVRGIFLRRAGTSREELLGIISSQLLPGYGYLLLVSSLATIYLKNRWYLLGFMVLAFSTDLVYQGKIFATVGLMVTMFYLDNIHFRFSLSRILLLIVGGFCFLILIFILRSLSVDAGTSDNLVGVYTFFSEFMGVNATAGWGLEFHTLRMPTSLFNFDPTLQKFYLSSVGHGLAISPVGYFLGNCGDWYLFFAAIYLIFVYLIFYFSSKVVGRFSLFVLMYNFIHLLRHGPDIFLYKCILQLIFLIVILCFIKCWEGNRGESKLKIK